MGRMITMQSIKHLTLALGCLPLAAVLHAQSTTTTVPTPSSVASSTSVPSGLLGLQYTEVSVGLADIEHFSNHRYSLTAGANTPVVPGSLDGGAFYRYSRIGGAQRGHANAIGGYFTGYMPLQGVKPFVTGVLGYEWTSAPANSGDHEPLWGAAAGVEIPAGAVTITPRVSYRDDFEGTPRSRQAWTYAVEANFWLSRSERISSIFGSVGWTEVRRSRFDAWNYEIGLRSRF